jgi:hypothetical protein
MDKKRRLTPLGRVRVGPTTPKRRLGKAATKLLARTKSVKTFAGARKVMFDNGAAVINGRITSREANIVNRAANPMIERLKQSLGFDRSA